MAPKPAKIYTLEELKAKCRDALSNPKLVEIVKTAPPNKDGRVNLSHAYDRAFEYVYGETKDLQGAKRLAVETRFLAMLRRDFEEEFEKLTAQKEQERKKTKTEAHKKLFQNIEFQLSHGAFTGIELITRHRGNGHEITVDNSVRFCSDLVNNDFDPREAGRKFCMEILNALVETADPLGDMDLMKDLIRLLEEKFGLKVRVCGSCGYLGEHPGYPYRPKGCTRLPTDLPESERVLSSWHSVDTLYGSCEHWTPKETSEKKEN